MMSTFSYRNGDNRYFLPVDGSDAARERGKRVGVGGRIRDGRTGSMVIWYGRPYCRNDFS
jgi:hypothetical protein